jgi:lipopolysaccharide export system permease protein
LLRLIDRHIAATATAAILVVLLAMLSLVSVFNLIEELQEGASGYTAANAVQYVLLTLPRRFQEVLPYALFLGTLIGLGMLSSQNEITVMRAAGVSVMRVFAALVLPLGVWLGMAYGVSEVVAPYAEKRAEMEKLQSKRGSNQIYVSGGHWFRDASLFMQISAIDQDGSLASITQYWLDDDGSLREVVHAARARFDEGQRDRWLLEDVVVTRLAESGVEVERLAMREWRNASPPDLIESQAFVEPHKMSIAELASQIDYASAQGLGDTDYRIAYWAKLLMPLSVYGLALLAVVATVGALREVGIGTRLLVGILTGLAFKYLQDLFAPMSAVYGLAPFVAVLAPIAVCWVVGLVGLRRIA